MPPKKDKGPKKAAGSEKADEEKNQMMTMYQQLEQDKINALVVRASEAVTLSSELQIQLDDEERKTTEFVHYFQHELEKKDALAAKLQAELNASEEALESTKRDLTEKYEGAMSCLSGEWKRTEDSLEAQLRQALEQLQKLDDFRAAKEETEARISRLEEAVLAQEARHRSEDADRERRFMVDKQKTSEEAEERMEALQEEMRSRLANEREAESASILTENKRIKDEMRFMKELMKELKEDKRRSGESRAKMGRELGLFEANEVQYAKTAAERSRETKALRDRTRDLEAAAAAAAATAKAATTVAAAAALTLKNSEPALAGGPAVKVLPAPLPSSPPPNVAVLAEKDALIEQLLIALASCKEIVAEARASQSTIAAAGRQGGDPRGPATARTATASFVLALKPPTSPHQARKGTAQEVRSSSSGSGGGEPLANSGRRSLQGFSGNGGGFTGFAPRAMARDRGGADGAGLPLPSSRGASLPPQGQQPPPLALPSFFPPGFPKNPAKLPHFLPPQQGRRHAVQGGQHPELFRSFPIDESSGIDGKEKQGRGASDVGGKRGGFVPERDSSGLVLTGGAMGAFRY